jgi:uncharacterized membrane protein YsdA (DUF1294 family)
VKYFWIYLALVNVIGFFLMKHDKELSRKKKWRVSERRIFTYAAVGGALGVWAGMLAYRHKTKHMSFVLGVPALAVVNAACVYLLLARLAGTL